ncbi:MAG: hypothetical protein WCR27_08495, partial [Eubacteriales bacterium]
QYVDVIKYFQNYYVSGINLLFLQYIISYFYNTNQIKEVDIFFDDLVDSIVTKRNEGEHFAIVINDVNSCHRGRDHFHLLVDKLREYDLHDIEIKKRYFDYGIRNIYQRYGEAYDSNYNLHEMPNVVREQYKPAIYCSSAQLIIEIK